MQISVKPKIDCYLSKVVSSAVNLKVTIFYLGRILSSGGKCEFSIQSKDLNTSTEQSKRFTWSTKGFNCKKDTDSGHFFESSGGDSP